MVNRTNHNKTILNTVITFFIFFVFNTTISEPHIINLNELAESGSKNRDNAENNNNSINSNIDYYYSYEKDNDHIHVEEAFYNRETGDSGRNEYCSHPHLHESYQDNNNHHHDNDKNKQSRDDYIMEEYIYKSCNRDMYGQMTEENASENYHTSTNAKSTKIHERDISSRVLTPDMSTNPILDSTALLKKIHTIADLEKVLSISFYYSAIAKQRFERIYRTLKKMHLSDSTRALRKKQYAFIKALLSGRVEPLIKNIRDPQLWVAYRHLEALKKLWPYKHDHTFLADQKAQSNEAEFITTLGIDIMHIAERAYITRQDYLDGHPAQEKDREIVQNYKNKCYFLQHQKNQQGLIDEQKRLSQCVTAENGSNLINNICLALAENCLYNPTESIAYLNVESAVANMLENNNTYEAVADNMNEMANYVLDDAKTYLPNLPYAVNEFVDTTIAGVRTAQNFPSFIFNVAAVEHTLTDINKLVQGVATKAQPILKRSGELLIRGMKKFAEELNPLNQAANMGHLCSNVLSAAGSGLSASWNALFEPLTTAKKCYNAATTACSVIKNTAEFVADVTVGKLYLSKEEYDKRIDIIDKFGDRLIKTAANITAEQWVDMAAQLAADFVFGKGVCAAFVFLQQIDAFEKAKKTASIITQAIKKAYDTHLADNPIAITAEGIVIKISDTMEKIGEATSSHLENIKTILPEINQTSFAILKDGYYEVNGFKFTEFYYNRLWQKGRKAPSLAAKAILENSISIIPDPEKLPGFFKYFAEGWEMIYNPTTKIVSHIQQI